MGRRICVWDRRNQEQTKSMRPRAARCMAGVGQVPAVLWHPKSGVPSPGLEDPHLPRGVTMPS